MFKSITHEAPLTIYLKNKQWQITHAAYKFNYLAVTLPHIWLVDFALHPDHV